jgi:hypothetical protein
MEVQIQKQHLYVQAGVLANLKSSIFSKFEENDGIARGHTTVCRTSDAARPVTPLA